MLSIFLSWRASWVRSVVGKACYLCRSTRLMLVIVGLPAFFWGFLALGWLGPVSPCLALPCLASARLYFALTSLSYHIVCRIVSPTFSWRVWYHITSSITSYRIARSILPNHIISYRIVYESHITRYRITWNIISHIISQVGTLCAALDRNMQGMVMRRWLYHIADIPMPHHIIS